MCCRFVIAGGVACNRSVRSNFAELAEDLQLELTIPDPHFCTDNGAMVAWAGLERLASPKHLKGPCKDLLASMLPAFNVPASLSCPTVPEFFLTCIP